MKKMVLTSIITCFLLTGVMAKSIHSTKADFEEEVFYYADFEGKVVTPTVPPDKVTDFIWAQEYLECKTETHNNSNMLYMSAASRNNDYSTLGGFGTGAKSNLAKLREGEPYQVSTYLEIHNMDYCEVEAVCGGNKWGAVRVHADGHLSSDPGGNNMVDVFYENNILSFKFTYTFNIDQNMNGYITFKAFNSNGGYAYFDNCKIASTEYVMEGTFEEYPVGVYNAMDDYGYRTIIYAHNSDIQTEIAKENNNKFLKFSYDNDSTEGKGVFYFNKLQFLNMNREYIFSFNLNTENVTRLYLRYGGDWISDKQEVSINMSNNEVTITGEKISQATYSHGLVTLRFTVSQLDGSASDSYQFQVITENVNGQKSTISVDNTKFKLIPVLSSIVVDATNAKRKFAYGETFAYGGVKVTGINSDGTTFIINPNDCEYSGYDMNIEGKQNVIVSYQGLQDIYVIEVVRVLQELIIDTTNVKKTYGYGEKLDLTGLVVKVSYVDGGEQDVLEHNALALYGYAVFAGGFNSQKNGTYTITIVYKHLFKTFDVTVSFDESYSTDGITYEKIGG